LSVHLPTYHLNQPCYVPNFLRSTSRTWSS
jgi:hypothetical protein